MLKIAYKLELFLLAILTLSPLFANSIRIQGRLTDKEGNPRKNAVSSLKFEIFPVSSGGASLWVKDYENIPTNEAGLFSTDIGPFTKEFFNLADDYYLQIAVDDFGWQVLKPRQRLSAVPFSIGAEYADISSTTLSVGPNSVGTAAIQDNAIESFHIKPRSIHDVHVATGTLKKEHLEDESISTEKIENEAVTKIKLSTNSVGTDQIENGSITKSKLGPDAMGVELIEDHSIPKEKLNFDFTTMRYIDTMWIEGPHSCSRGTYRHRYIIPLAQPLKGTMITMIGEISVDNGRYEEIKPSVTVNQLRVDVEIVPMCPPGTPTVFYKALVHFFEMTK